MEVWIYISGVIAALVAFAIIVYKDKRLTVGILAKILLYSLLSWITVLSVILASLFCFVNWDKEIWRGKK